MTRLKSRLAGWLVRLAFRLHWDAARRQGQKANRERKEHQARQNEKRHRRRVARGARIVHSS